MSKLRDLADIRVSNVDKRSYASERPVKLCNYMDAYANDYVTGALEFMQVTASLSEIERFALHAGDVVITKDSETPDDIGVPAVIVEEIDSLVCGYHLALIRPKLRAVHPIYLAKHLASSSVVRYFAANATGSTRYGLAVGTIERLDVPVPPPAEQAKIAEVLCRVDRAIEQTEVLITKQQRIKVGLMQDLLTRGIDEHGDLRSKQTHAFKNSRLGRIPVEWSETSIGNQFVVRRERGRSGLPVMAIVMSDGLVERSSVDRRVETALVPAQHALVCEGDIAYNMMRMWQGVLGRASFDCLVSPAYVVLRPLESINSRFAEWLFRDARMVHAFRQASKGVVDDRLRLYPKDLFPISMAIPQCKQEQSQIADRLDAQVAVIATEIRALEKLRHLRAGLMQDLLSGNRRVTALLEQRDAVMP